MNIVRACKAPIINYSGKTTEISYRLIKVLKKHRYIVDPNPLPGDAPKEKITIWEPGRSSVKNTKTWVPYICKVGHKWYPGESITEHLITRIGQEWGFKMANSKLYYIEEQVRFCSEIFLKKNEELVHGADILASYLKEQGTGLIELIDRKGWSQELLTFQIVKEAIEQVFPDQANPIVNGLVKMLLLDAVTGNNDRHFFNWGVIRNIKEPNKPIFAPIYDTARGLFWNWSDDKINQLLKDRKQLKSEIEKYNKQSKPKIGWDNYVNLNHFEMIANLFMTSECSYDDACSILNNKNLEKIEKMLKTEFNGLIFDNRNELILYYLNSRFNEFKKLLN